jgi:hypothetical protein
MQKLVFTAGEEVVICYYIKNFLGGVVSLLFDGESDQIVSDNATILVNWLISVAN